MIDKIKNIIAEADTFKAKQQEDIEQFRIKYLGKKGIIKQLYTDLKTASNDQKRALGQIIQKLKITAENKIIALQKEFEDTKNSQSVYDDLTRPGESINIGSRHPISIVKNQIIDIFSRIGFNVSEGPEIEDDWHNFTALNLPKHHPARDMQDTFFIQTNPDILLRNCSISSCCLALKVSASAIIFFILSII